MKLIFSGIEMEIEVTKEFISILEIANKRLYSRICQSLSSSMGELAIEPYTLWNEDYQLITASDSLLVIQTPMVLPFDDKCLIKSIINNMESMLLDDIALMTDIRGLFKQINTKIASVTYQLDSDYSYNNDWSLSKYLIAASFAVEKDSTDSILDNCIKFLALLSDASFKDVLIFINLKAYLNTEDLVQLYENSLFYGLKMLIIEPTLEKISLLNERKYTIDLHFLETQSDKYSPMQMDDAPTVLEQCNSDW